MENACDSLRKKSYKPSGKPSKSDARNPYSHAPCMAVGVSSFFCISRQDEPSKFKTPLQARDRKRSSLKANLEAGQSHRVFDGLRPVREAVESAVS